MPAALFFFAPNVCCQRLTHGIRNSVARCLCLRAINSAEIFAILRKTTKFRKLPDSSKYPNFSSYGNILFYIYIAFYSFCSKTSFIINTFFWKLFIFKKVFPYNLKSIIFFFRMTTLVQVCSQSSWS